jgi:hypothetical protein
MEPDQRHNDIVHLKNTRCSNIFHVIYTMFHVPRVIDHYEDLPEKLPEIVNISSNECLICLEIYTDSKSAPIDWKTQKIYLKLCACGGWLHIDCVSKWHSVANTCPICRKIMTTNDAKKVSFFLDMRNITPTKIFVFILYCCHIWNIFIWTIIATLCSYHIYSTYNATPRPNIFTDDDMFAIDLDE